jgi:Flp pilus assembly CpaF family ATPase
MLRTALGPAIATFLEDPSIVEVMLNPDGRLWIDRLSGGLEDSGRVMSAADGERIVRLVAHHVGAEVHGQLDLLVAERALIAARAAQADSDAHLADDEISLFQALGGGWEVTPPAESSIGSLPDALPASSK